MSTFSAILQALITVAKTDAQKLVLPLLANFLNSIATNPTEINIIAQLASFEAGLLAVLPTIEQDELKELSSILQTEATSLLNASSTPAKAVPAPTPASS
jgi:hypothetical protein